MMIFFSLFIFAIVSELKSVLVTKSQLIMFMVTTMTVIKQTFLESISFTSKPVEPTLLSPQALKISFCSLGKGIVSTNL